ncbi:MAG: hypothetical protein V3S40_03180 [Kiloniellales bacterium]
MSLIGAILATLAGCSTGVRAEALYMYQHRTLAALTTAIDMVEPKDPDLADRLYDTEDELQAACAPLVEAGNRRFHAQEIDRDLQWRVYQSLDGCANKTHEVERMLWAVNPESARRYLEAPHIPEDRR